MGSRLNFNRLQKTDFENVLIFHIFQEIAMNDPDKDRPPPSYDEYGGYPAQAAPYTSQQGAYPPQQGAYSLQQGAYPPQQGAYSLQQGAYPPQQGAYPPQQGTYPLQQGAYPTQQGAYPLQQGAYPPQYAPPGPAHPTEGTYPPNQKVHVDVDVGYCTNDTEILIPVESGGLSDPDIRRGFIRKVYLILCVQFGITVATIYLMQHFVGNLEDHYYSDLSKKVHIAMWSCFAIFFAIKMVLLCSPQIRRKHPINIILLFLFTLAMSGCVGCITLYYSVQAVTIAMGSTCIITLSLTLFACQTKIDFTNKGVYIFAAFMVFVCFGFFMIFYWVQYLQVIFGCAGVLIYSMLLVYNTQLLIGGRKYQLSPEEYVFGALTLYIDVIRIFLRLLLILRGLGKNLNFYIAYSSRYR